MRPLTLISSLLFILLISACSLEKKEQALYFEPELVEQFNIPKGIDTTLLSEEGFQLIIAKNTLISEEESIHLEIVTARSKYRMVKNKLTTLTTTGEILESDGMIFFKPSTSFSINPDAPIKVKAPTQKYAADMQLFKAENKDGQTKWQQYSELTETSALQNIQNGAALFDQYCASCHNRDLRNDMTGPALGNITLFRDSSFLVDFTRNSSQLISSGNLLANCLFDHWNRSVMTSFDTLSVDQIMSIYQWIESESRNKDIGLNEVFYIDSCAQVRVFNYTYDEQGNILDSVGFDRTLPVDSLGQLLFTGRRSGHSISKQLDYYEFDVQQFGWYNVDFFINGALIDNFKIQVDQKDAEKINVLAVFKNRNVIIPLEYFEGYYYLMSGRSKEKIAFPLNEELLIVAIEESAEAQIYFATKAIVSKANDNEYQLSLTKTSKEVIVQKLNE